MARETGSLSPKLLETIDYAARHSPFYREMFSASGVSPAKIRTREDFRKIPLTRKSDLCARNRDFIASPGPFREWVTTSGTSTEPVALPLTPKDLERLAENEYRALSGAGIVSGDTVLLAVSMERLFIAGMAYYSGLARIGAAVLRCGVGSVELVVRTLDRFRPSAVIGVPSFLAKAGRAALKQGIRPRERGIRRVVAIGEPVARFDYSRNGIGSVLEEIWGAPVLSTYASSEMATSFCECPRRKGGHCSRELIDVEILDEEGRPVPPGQAGEVVVTPLGIEGVPLVRYATGDIAALDPAPCECGFSGGRLSPILGRKSRRLKIRGTTVFLSSVLDALSSMDNLEGYFVSVCDRNELSDELVVKVCPASAEDPEETIDALRGKLKGLLKITPRIVRVSAGEIAALHAAHGSKKRFFEDLRDAPPG